MIHIDDLTEHLGVDADSDDLELLENLEKQAVAFVEQQTQRYFGPIAEYTEVITGNDGNRIWLAETPVANPADEYSTDALVVVDEAAYAGASATAFESGTDYALRGNLLVRFGRYNAWWRDYEYTVTYYRGYGPGTEPEDIRKLVIDIVRQWYESIGETTGLKSETIGGYSYTRDGSADIEAIPGAAKTLEMWTRRVFA